MFKIAKDCRQYIKFIAGITQIKVFAALSLCLLQLITTCLNGITIPYLSKYILDNVVAKSNLSFLLNVVLVILVVYVVYLVLDISNTYLSTKWKISLDFNVKENYYRIMNTKTQLEMSKISPMDLFYRMFQDGQIMTDYMYTVFVYIPCYIIFCIIVFFIMLNWSVQLSFYTLILVAINILSIILLREPINKLNRLLKSVNQQVADYVMEKLGLVPFAQINNICEWWEDKVHSRFNAAKKITIKNTFVMKLLTNLTNLFKQLWSIGFIVIGVYLMSKHKLSLGSFFGFQSLAMFFVTPLNSLVIGIYAFQDTKVSYQRYREYYDFEAIQEGNVKKFINCDELKFDSVTFSYPNSERILIENFSATFKHGTLTAVVGENGAGKSTFMSLASRLLIPKSGEIFIDNIDISDISFDSYYRKVAFMPQNDVVFNDTFYNNLVMNGHYSKTQVEEVVNVCGLDQIINRLPYCMNTILGVNGVNLSGGEARRLALARILLKQPKLIWLDEPTNSIDEESLVRIVTILKEYKKKGDAIVIINTHSDYIIENADRKVEL